MFFSNLRLKEKQQSQKNDLHDESSVILLCFNAHLDNNDSIFLCVL